MPDAGDDARRAFYAGNLEALLGSRLPVTSTTSPR
jgi:hypothetical protein